MGNRKASIGEQTVWGTTVALTTDIDFINESISHERNINMPQTVGFLSPTAQTIGLYKVSGSIESLGIADDILYWFHMLFARTSIANAGGGKWTSTFLPNQTVNYYTVAILKEGLSRLYNSMFVTGWTLGIDKGVPTTNSFDVIARSDAIGVDSAPVVSADRNYFHGSNAVITIGGVSRSTFIQSMEVSVKGNADEDNYSVNSQFLVAPVRTNYEITVTADLRFDNEIELRRFYDGLTTGSTGKSPGNTITTFAIVATLTDNNSNVLAVTLPAVVWDTESGNMNERDHVIQNMTGKCIYDDTTGGAVKVELTSNRYLAA